MNKIILATALALSLSNARAQLIVQNGSTITTTGNTTISLADMDLQNNGTINQAAGAGKFVFRGTANNKISGSSSTTFNVLEIAKTGSGKLSLLQNITVAGNINFTSGLIDLNNNNILLQPSATLIGESETSRITGNAGGYVEINALMNAPSSANPGNLGAVITSAQNMGTTTIRRGHISQVNSAAMGNSIYRYYDINPTNNTALDATLRLNYFDAELNGLSEGTLVLLKSPDNSNWINMGYTTRDGATNYVEKTSIADFSRWTLSSTGNILPLVFTSFTVSCNNGTASINWKTAQEQNTHHFELQKSKDGMFWQAFATIAAAGNSTTERSYSSTDKTPFDNGTIYRVAEHDVDGKTFYTKAERLLCNNSKNDIAIYPNPIQDQFTISLAANTASMLSIKILDEKGALVYAQNNALQLGNNQVNVNAKQLPSSNYFLQLKWNNGQTKKTIKLIKQ